MYRANLVCGLLAAGACLTALATGHEWDQISAADGITVYQKNLAGSDVISLRGEALIMATAVDIAAVMKDGKLASDWMPLVSSRHVLAPLSATERIECTHISLPWPVKDRYFINLAKIESLPNGVLHLSIHAVEKPDPAWLESDKVLGEMHLSEFVLTPVNQGTATFMTMEVHTDPQGMIPKFLVNLAQRSWPRDFFTGLNQELAKLGKLRSSPVAH